MGGQLKKVGRPRGVRSPKYKMRVTMTQKGKGSCKRHDKHKGAQI